MAEYGRVYRRRNERFSSSCVQEVDSYGGGSVMMWAAISNDSKTELVHVLGNLTRLTLQQDLYKLSNWGKNWKMAFHPDKCNVISVTRNKKPIKFNDTLHGHTLDLVTKAKFLGVTISSDLKWESHIKNITKKANNTLGFLGELEHKLSIHERASIQVPSQTITRVDLLCMGPLITTRHRCH